MGRTGGGFCLEDSQQRAIQQAHGRCTESYNDHNDLIQTRKSLCLGL